MWKLSIKRSDRKYRSHTSSSDYEFRSPFERDHDRVLYSSAFRRLAGVTQVVNPSEGQIFHNRLTHSIKVAQIGRRLAEKLLRQNKSKEQKRIIETSGGLNPSTVEAAALAHDLGNPPFGHLAEKELDRIITPYASDGFEGNAQSFRIINKLCFGYPSISGINLTRATLNAVLKYPWLRKDKPNSRKFGAYETETEEFEWAREMCPNLGNIKTLEAALMDLADDITYAVHDYEDFYRANIIPPIEQIKYELSVEKMCTAVSTSDETWFRREEGLKDLERKVESFRYMFGGQPTKTPFVGTSEERTFLRGASSKLIARFVESVELNADLGSFACPIELVDEAGIDLIILKYITRYYVIDNPGLIRQQFGEAQIISSLFDFFWESIHNGSDGKKIFPKISQEKLDDLEEGKKTGTNYARIVADTISYLSDNEAINLFRKLSGISPGSVFDHLA